MNFENLVIIVLFILVIYCLLKYDKKKEQFFVLDQNKCNETLVTDGTKFYIFKDRQPYVKGKNPLVFDTLEDAEKVRNKNCKKLEVVNLLVDKDLEDPTENYERQCSKKYSPYFNKLNNWGSLLDRNQNSEVVKKCESVKNNLDTDNIIEDCMRKKISDDELKKKLFYF